MSYHIYKLEAWLAEIVLIGRGHCFYLLSIGVSKSELSMFEFNSFIVGMRSWFVCFRVVLVRDETLGGGLVLELCFYFLRIIFLSNTPVIKFSSTLSSKGQLMRLAIFCAPSYSSPLDASSMSRPWSRLRNLFFWFLKSQSCYRLKTYFSSSWNSSCSWTTRLTSSAVSSLSRPLSTKAKSWLVFLERQDRGMHCWDSTR